MVIECLVCGQEFEKTGRRIYCSDQCASASRGQKKFIRNREIEKNRENLEKIRKIFN